MRHSVEDEPEVADGTRERRSPLRFRTRHSAGRRARRACAETPGQSDDAVRSAKAGSETIPISEPTPSLARRRTYPRNRAQENVNAPRRRPTFRPIDESNAAGVARARQFYRPRRCFTPNMNGQVQSSRERLGGWTRLLFTSRPDERLSTGRSPGSSFSSLLFPSHLLSLPSTRLTAYLCLFGPEIDMPRLTERGLRGLVFIVLRGERSERATLLCPRQNRMNRTSTYR